MNKSHENEKRLQILSAIAEYTKKHGYPPTVREIGDMVSLKSTSSVQRHLNIMFKEGMLEADEKLASARAIRIPGYKFVKVNN